MRSHPDGLHLTTPASALGRSRSKSSMGLCRAEAPDINQRADANSPDGFNHNGSPHTGSAREGPTIIDGQAWTARGQFWSARAVRRRGEPLVIAGHGIAIRVKRGALAVSHGFTHFPQPKEQQLFFPGERRRPRMIIVLDAASGVITFDAMFWCAEQQVPLILLDYQGTTTALTPVGAYINRQLQERQRTVASDRSAALRIARELIVQKIEAARETLSITAACNASSAIANLTDALAELHAHPPRTLSALLGIEGRTAAAYFTAWRSIPLRWIGTGRHPIPEDWRTIGSRTAAPGEGNRNARHPVNAALNFGYALLESRVRIGIATHGLYLAVGFMHGPQRPKEAPRSPLALDLMEPLRPIVDRAVLAFLGERALRPPDFVITSEGVCRLHPQLARVLVAAVNEALGEKANEEVRWLAGELQQIVSTQLNGTRSRNLNGG
jgi:CRISP-associated protein Cas1